MMKLYVAAVLSNYSSSLRKSADPFLKRPPWIHVAGMAFLGHENLSKQGHVLAIEN